MMNRDLFRQVKRARISLGCAVILGVLGAAATIAQMALLSKVVDRVFLDGEGLEGVRPLLLLLLGAVVLRSSLLWLREVVARRGAIRIRESCGSASSPTSCASGRAISGGSVAASSW